jgi:molybdopterin/thiamine biosynthesis adenylyltransferase
MGLLQEQPKRIAHERRLLLEHSRLTPGFNVQSWGTTADGELCLNFRLDLPAGEFEGALVYPDLFPDVPAFVRPRKHGESWSGHQYKGSGVLCLQYGPDNWHPAITGVDLIRSANLLLLGEQLAVLDPRLGPVPSRHALTVGQDLRGSAWRLLVTPGMRQALSNADEDAPTELTVALSVLTNSAVAMPTGLGKPSEAIPDIPKEFSEARFALSGWAVPVDSTDAFEAVKDIKAMQAALGSAWPWEEDLDDRFCALLVHDGRGDVRFFVLSGGTKPLFREYRVLEICGDGEQRLPESFRGLADATVTVVGLGSLGSKIAVSLARSGVHRFILIDDDVVLPENLVRNELNWLDVGFAKIEAVERELRRIAPGIDVKTSSVRVGGQENPQLAANLSELISKSSLVIDATADPQAFIALSALVARCNVAMVWGVLFGGGGGALMARSRPGTDAAPLGVRNSCPRRYGDDATRAAEGRFRDYGIEGDGRVYIASDADVTALAASMSQFALDTLCADGDSAYPVAAYLIGFRNFWAFQCPFDTIPIDCSGAIQTAPEPDELTDEELTDLAELEKAIELSANGANNDSS